MPRFPLIVVRLVSALALLLVATLYLLSSIPFAYYHFVQFPHSLHLWWVPAFIQWHPLIQALAVAALVPTLGGLPESLRPWIRYVAIVGAMSAACMGATVLWPILNTDEMAAALYVTPIFILGTVGALDLVAQRAAVAAASRRHDVRDVMFVAILGGLLSAALYLLHAGLLPPEQQVSLQPQEIIVAVAATLLGHLAVFAVAAFVVLLPRVVASRWGWSPWAEYLGVLGATTVVVAVLVRRVLLTSLAMDSLRAAAVAVSLAMALVLYGAALVVRGAAPTGRRTVVQPGSLSATGDGTRWGLVVMSVPASVICVVVLPRALLLVDWGTTFQELVVCITWVSALVLLMQLRAGRSRRFSTLGVLAMVVVGVAATTVAARQPGARPNVARRPLDVDLAIERYATVNPSLRVVLDLVRPMVTETQFFFDLERIGDVTDSRALRAVPLRVVEHPGAGSTYRPNIFIFVIDSLRPDYLSAYNHDVTFTPAIGAFANESIVMRHAFAPYTGTALSEPALWAGGMIPRRMYVQPFSAVNNLERLAVLGGYRQYISVDEILSVILGDVPNMVRLDAHLAHPERIDEMYKFDLCATQAELTERLDHDRNQRAPIFFFAQPQSVHIRVLAGDHYPEFEEVRRGESSFFKPAVAALGRIDACFGQFVDYLKARDLYDDSIVILTSDHGDYYGESGRWGHAFYVGPETVKIPLIMHIPQKLRAVRQWDPNAVAMLTDVTPTLYDLLGFGPVLPQELVGRPLLAPAGQGPEVPSRDVYLMQSSYSRIFGLLDGHGEWLYTASANQVREEFFDLRGDQSTARSLTQAERLLYRKWLLERIARVNAHYRPD